MKRYCLQLLAVITVISIMMCGCATRYDNSAGTPSPLAVNNGSSSSPTAAATQEPASKISGKAGASVIPGKEEDGTGGDQKPVTQINLGGGLHKYKMDLELDEQGKLLTGHISIEYNNHTGTQLESIPFHVYPNTYLSEDTAPFFQNEMEKAYPHGFSTGGLEVSNLKVGDADATHTIENDDSTLMMIALPQPLENEGSVMIDMDFTVTIPNSLGRFGYGEKTINLCNFYPIAAAWSGSEFYKYPYYMAGDPFVSDVSDYEVTLRVPEGMLVAHSGSGESSTESGMTTYTINAPMVRDFAAVASREFEVASKKVGNTNVKSYYYKGQDAAGKSALSYGAGSIEVFNNAFGKYPYDDYSVIQTDFFIGGMEYPGLVLIDQSLYDIDMMLEYVVVHETAHQWWYGVIGNDEVMEPWIDEALAEYSSIMYFGDMYDESTRKTMYNIFVEYQAQYLAAEFGTDPKGVGEPAKNFDNAEEYSYCIYINGSKMYHEIEKRIGLPRLKKALSAYYKANMYGRVTGSTLIDTLNKESGEDLSDLFNKWLKLDN